MDTSCRNKGKTFTEFACSKKAMIISGIVCAIPFVFEKMFLLSWIAYVPLAAVFFGTSKHRCGFAVRAFIFGYFYYLVGYSWLASLYPMDFAGFTNAESAAIIILALTAIPAIHSAILAVSFSICKKISDGLSSVFKIFAFPCVFVFAEFLQSLGELAFPWCRIFITQSGSNAVLQSGNLFGSYFITYIVLLSNAILTEAFFNQSERKRKIIYISAAVSVFCLNFLYGTVRIALFDYGDKSFTGIALQGNFSSSAKWSGSTDDMLGVYFELSSNALSEAPENNGNVIVLMPETGIPVIINEYSRYSERLAEYAEENSVTFAAGAFSDKGAASGNSIFLFSPDGKMSEPYSKRHLVPFGEKLPYRTLLTAVCPALAEINMLKYDLYEGTDTAVWDAGFAKIGAVICYESIFPELCRESVRDGAEILLLATNDSWFGESQALRHHLAAARMRAIENNVPVVRAANTGISALINSDGTVEQSLGASQKGYVCAELKYGGKTTLYTLIGDVWIAVCAAVVCCGALGKIILKIRR